jgi:hypothetical protein
MPFSMFFFKLSSSRQSYNELEVINSQNKFSSHFLVFKQYTILFIVQTVIFIDVPKYSCIFHKNDSD